MITDPARREAITRRMTDVIIERLNDTGRCHRDDLIVAGFTPADIDRYSVMAHSLAAVSTQTSSTERN